MMIKRSISIAFFLACLGALNCIAAEITNIQTGQTAKQAYIQYDLIGKPGEKNADVIVNLEINGKRYSSEKLALTGDFGKNTKVGLQRRIWWNLLKDMPSGYSGDLIWDLNVSEILSDTHFDVTSHTVLDNKTKLMWSKLGKYAKEKMTFDKARSFITLMNNKKFGGFSDWRLPTVDEFTTLYNSAKAAGLEKQLKPYDILSSKFSGLENWNYWTAIKTYLGVPNVAPIFDIEHGTSKLQRRTDDECIIAVRGGKETETLDEW